MPQEVRSQRCVSAVCGPDKQFAMLHGSILLEPLVPATACATANSPVAPINSKTGLFHDPSVSGQGVITVAGTNAFFAGWFAADPSDAVDDPQKQAWFTLQADVSANIGDVVNAKIYRTVGGRRDTPLSVLSLELGTATLTYTGCDRLSVQYQFGTEEFVAAFRGRSGTLNLERIGACQR